MNKNKWFLNGGRESGRTFRLLCETYENKIADLEEKLANADYQIEGRDLEIKELKEKLGNLYEIIKRPYQFIAPRKIQMVKEAEQFLKENKE